MLMKLYYRKNSHFDMRREDALRLTVADFLENYELVLKAPWPDSTSPEDVFIFYQDRPIPLPATVRHSSMSVGDIVVLDSTVFVCLDRGWYAVDYTNLPPAPLAAG
jgi:hypothetical protein